MSEEKQKCPHCTDGYSILYTQYGHEKAGICPTCNGKGYLDAKEIARQKRFEEELKKVFVCEHCGSDKVHYRKWGYRCPNRCEDEILGEY